MSSFFLSRASHPLICKNFGEVVTVVTVLKENFVVRNETDAAVKAILQLREMADGSDAE